MARLFHSLVVCGAGLTLLECGGRVAGHEGGDDQGATSAAGQTSSAGQNNDGHGASSSLGGASAQAGSAPSIGGLHLGGFGTGGLDTGGSPAAGTASGGATVIVPPGAQAQWDCDGANISSCEFNGGSAGPAHPAFNIDVPCRTNPDRPKESDDCPANTLLTCFDGTYAGQSVLFNCECVSPQGADACTCPAFHAGCAYSTYQPVDCTTERALCGCAQTCILK
ncbi:MAG TPA: hypothetical protein VHB79_03070 [Polyangiaceae bacterium]|nr:hypothetical protein [Polyangiaceae bacterium]